MKKHLLLTEREFEAFFRRHFQKPLIKQPAEHKTTGKTIDVTTRESLL